MSRICQDYSSDCGCLPGQDPYVSIIYPTNGSSVGACFYLDLKVCNVDLTQCGNRIQLLINDIDTHADIYNLCQPILMHIWSSGDYTLTVNLIDANGVVFGTGDSRTITVDATNVNNCPCGTGFTGCTGCGPYSPCDGCTGPTGLQGPTGPRGLNGSQGPQGPPGPRGECECLRTVVLDCHSKDKCYKVHDDVRLVVVKKKRSIYLPHHCEEGKYLEVDVWNKHKKCIEVKGHNCEFKVECGEFARFFYFCGEWHKLEH